MIDPAQATHAEWLHGKLYEFLKEKDNVKVAIAKHHVKIAFDDASRAAELRPGLSVVVEVRTRQ